MLQTVILVMHLGRLRVESNGFSVLCALQVLLLWLRLQYFARVLQPTRQPFMETLRAVISEVILQPRGSNGGCLLQGVALDWYKCSLCAGEVVHFAADTSDHR